MTLPALSATLTETPTRDALPRSSFAVNRPFASVVGKARNGSAVVFRTEIAPPATPDPPSETETVIVFPLARDTTAFGACASRFTVRVNAVRLPAASSATRASSC